MDNKTVTHVNNLIEVESFVQFALAFEEDLYEIEYVLWAFDEVLTMRAQEAVN